MRGRKKALLAGKLANVTYSRNGLTIEVQNVPAQDGAQVAQGLLNVMRELIQAGYEELVLDAGSFHASGHEFPEDAEEPDSVLPTHSKKPKLGFARDP